MKRLISILSMAILPIMAVAQVQEEKEDTGKTVSSELSALQTAASLARYGYANYSPTALIEAAKIFADTQVQNLDADRESGGEPQESKGAEVSFNPEQLLIDARKYAGKDKVVLALANKVEKSIKSTSTRGAVGGAKYAEDRVYGKSYVQYQAKFWANELAEVIVIGDGHNDLDLYIYDQNGNLIASDDDYTDQCVCRWIPAWTGTFTIRIVNRGAIYSNYAIATN